MYTVRISLVNVDKDKREQIIKTCEYCREHDKFGSFNYAVFENSLLIECENKDIAHRRASYFKKKFDVYYNIIRKTGSSSK